MKVKDIIKICDGILVFGNEDLICENFSKDTRTINVNDVYVGIKGENFDGNILYQSALEKGAKVCILQDVQIDESVKKIYEADRAIIVVDNTIKALQKIAQYKRSLYNIPVIAVTGSVGKTSTKDIIASVVGTKYKVHKTQGNFNNHIGLPLTILGLKNHEVLVVEMGMNNLGEISLLSKIAKPTIGVITNVGTSHIGNLGSRENILKAKLEILDGMNDNGILIINNDNDLLHEWYKNYKGNIKVITYGIENKSDVMALNINLKEDSSDFDVDLSPKAITSESDLMIRNVNMPIGGTHFVYNALCAICVGITISVSNEDIKYGIRKFELSKNRMELINLPNDVVVINDCYNANYDSMKAGIEYLSKTSANRKIAVLGDMLELGEFSEELHKKVGEEIIKNRIDILITVGEMGKVISDTVSSVNSNVYNCKNNEEAVRTIKKIICKDDIILVKASNGMKFKQIIDGLQSDINNCYSKIKIGVIFGGMSTEHDISVVSGSSIIKNLNKEKYEIIPIYINKIGDWFLYSKNVDEIEIFKIGEEPVELQRIENPIKILKKLDVVFPVLHGLYGEDGTIQGMLELLKVPYVGCKVLASCVCMDKVYTKIILEKANINQAKYVYIQRVEDNGYLYFDDELNGRNTNLQEICQKVTEKLGLPVFVKPSNSGSSVGINKAENIDELREAIKFASQYDSKIIIEENINGSELECAVIGNNSQSISCVGEILPADDFYSFDAKYKNSASKISVPADISNDIAEQIRNIAGKAYKAVDARGLARVDFFVEKGTNKIYLNEINTMPGFTNISMYPQLWEKCGKPYAKLLDELVENAKLS